ncbi:MAG: Lactoylglutathione lyase @ Cadmium-induced protein CadI, partial [uncultured Acidimicrobiales bacterium]
VPCPARSQRHQPRRRDRVLHQALLHRARQGPTRVRQLRGGRPAAQAGSDRGRGRRDAEPPRSRGRLDRGGGRRVRSPVGRRPGHRRGVGCLLLRRAGEGLGGRPGRRAVGGVHGPGRCRAPAGPSAQRRARPGQRLLLHRLGGSRGRARLLL